LDEKHNNVKAKAAIGNIVKIWLIGGGRWNVWKTAWFLAPEQSGVGWCNMACTLLSQECGRGLSVDVSQHSL
jgi:hypothetical protein